MTTAPLPRARPNGWYGMLLLVATESALFGTLLATYAYLRFYDPRWPPPGIAPPSVTAPLVLALVLVATTIPMALASRTARRGGSARLMIAAIALALIVQVGYLAFQVHLFADDLDRFSPKDSAYGSIYFTMLAIHHAHVGVGVLLDCWLLGRLRGGLTRYRRTAVMAVALYWYFVGVVGLAVTATILSPAW